MFSKKDYNLTDAFREIMKKAEKTFFFPFIKKMTLPLTFT